MKRNIFFLFTSMIFWFASFSQAPDSLPAVLAQMQQHIKQNPVRNSKMTSALRDSIYYYEGDDSSSIEPKQKEFFQYESHGLVTQNIKMHYVSGEWVNFTNTIITYFPDLQFKSFITFPWNTDQEQWDDTLYYFEYNSQGLTKSYIIKYWDPSQNNFYGGIKGFYTYDNNMRISEYISFIWKNNTWVKNTKVLYTYNQTPSYLEYVAIKYIFDTITNTWIKSLRETERLNSHYLTTYSLIQYWDENLGAWENYRLESYEYKYDTLETAYIKKTWDTTNYIWQIVEIDSTYYSPNLDTMIFTNYFPDNQANTVVPYKRIFKKFNLPLDQETEKVIYYYNRTTGEFIPNSRIFTVYGQYGIVLKVSQSWSTSDNTWVNANKVVTNYYSTGLKKEEIAYSWDNTIPDWIYSRRDYYEYNSMGYTTLTETYFWSSSQNQWIKRYIFKASYNDYGKRLNSFSMNLTGNDWVYSTKSYYTYLDDTLLLTKWTYRRTANPPWKYSEYFYTYTTVSNVTKLLQNVSLYPNPATDWVSIKGLDDQATEIKIFDQQGRIIKKIYYTNSKIDVSDLSPGIYLIYISANKSDYLLKLIKK